MSAETLGSLTLSNVASAAFVEDELGSSFLDSGIKVPHRDGIRVDSQAPYGPRTIVLKTVIRATNSSGAITHADGASGHAYENLHLIQKELSGTGLVTLARTAPHIGAVRALVRLLDPPVSADGWRTVRWVLTCPSGSWQTTTQTSSATTAVTTGGNRRIHDPIIVFASATTITHTHSDGVVESITAAAGPTYPVTVDVGEGTILDSTATPADVRGSVTFTQPWWLRMEPDGAQTFTGTGTIKYRNRWA